MKAFELVEFGKPFQAVEREDPTPTGTEVVVRVRRSGVCHSDIHIRHGYFDYGEGRKMEMAERGMKLPLTLGHEVFGEVVGAGPAAGAVPIGASRLVFPWIGCQTCDRCRAGRDNDCTAMSAIGILRNGGYATHVVVPHPKYLVDIGDLDPTLATPHACSGLTVYAALKKTGLTETALKPDEWLAVFGAGGLGLNAVAIGKALGAQNLVAIDLSAEKLAAAAELGATATMTIDEGAERLKQITGGKLMAAVDTVGAPSTVEMSIEAMMKTGAHVIVGLHGGSAKLPIPMLAQKAMSLRGSYVGSLEDLKELIALVQTGRVAPMPVSTRPLETASDTLDDLEAGRITGRVVLTTD